MSGFTPEIGKILTSYKKGKEVSENGISVNLKFAVKHIAGDKRNSKEGIIACLLKKSTEKSTDFMTLHKEMEGNS